MEMYFIYRWETEARRHKRQVGIAFRLCIYGERNNGNITVKISLL